MTTKRGLIHIYTGNGKGKTTAAVGLALRAIGWGRKVCVFQFMKKGLNGEYKATSLLGGRLKCVTFNEVHPAFYPKRVREKQAKVLKDKMAHDLGIVKKTMLFGNYDIIILDEIVNAVKERFIERREFLSLIKSKPSTQELILTGRGAPAWLIKEADYVTEMCALKHPYQKGLKARKGIEY